MPRFYCVDPIHQRRRNLSKEEALRHSIATNPDWKALPPTSGDQSYEGVNAVNVNVRAEAARAARAASWGAAGWRVAMVAAWETGRWEIARWPLQ